MHGRALISKSEQVIVQLEGRANDLRDEVVSFGLPLPFGFLNDPREVRVLAEDGTELVAAVRSLNHGGQEVARDPSGRYSSSSKPIFLNEKPSVSQFALTAERDRTGANLSRWQRR